jgi:hypothetical protein
LTNSKLTELKMFKTIGRILIILLVTALVAGGLYALVQSSGANSSATAPEPRFSNQPTGQRQSPPEGFRERGGDHGGESEFSLGRGLAGMLGTFLKMSVVTLLVLLVQKMLTKSPRQTQSGSA